MLPRRLARMAAYVVVVMVGAAALLTVAHHKHYIDLDPYLPYLAPSFFQPPADSYVVDVAVRSCFKLNANSPACGLPAPTDGAGPGVWQRVEKDLALGSGLLAKQYLSVKAAKYEALADIDLVVTDIAVYNPASDDGIQGNRKIPLKVLKQLRSGDVFDQEDHDDLASHGVQGQVHSDEEARIKAAEDARVQEEVAAALAAKDPPKAKDPAKAKPESESGSKPESDPVEDSGEDGSDGEKADSKKTDPKASPDQKADSKAAAEKGKQDTPEAEAAALKHDADTVNDVGAEDLEALDPDSKDKDSDSKDKDKDKDTDSKDKDADSKDSKDKRQVETDRTNLNMYYEIPSDAQLKEKGWVQRDHGIWLKYESHRTKRGITAVDVLFGDDCVDPRPNWTLINGSPVRKTKAPAGKLPYITFRRGPKADYSAKKYRPTLKPREGKFKILQVADLHFSTGVGKCRDQFPRTPDCMADPRTLRFIDQVLELEKPDLVVMTGDQVFGDAAPDAESALYKALNPFIKRKIPYAVTMGNHDDEGSLSRKELMNICSDLPYSFSAIGPQEVDGFGNFIVNIEENGKSAILLFFLDSHKYSANPKASPGYDWIKSSQLLFMEREHGFIEESKGFTPAKNHLSMAFFHIPLPEYRHVNQPLIGEYREGITAPKRDTGVRKVLGELGVHAVSVGHDHCNDYCLQDTADKDKATENKLWLCYGGGVGEGGYGGYNNYVRRVRVFDFNTKEGEIRTWKRKHDDPETTLDEQRIVYEGQVVNF